MTTSELSRSVLVVLEQAQHEARAAELAKLARPGVDVVHEESPDAALDLVAQKPPALVLVGMTIGAMEGLEFLAMLLKRSPGFQGKVVVLPDKGDPFPPMLQGRDPITKKSTTTAIDFAGIESIVETIARSAPEAPPAAPAPAPPPPTPVPALAERAHEVADVPLPAPPARIPTPLLIGAGVILVVGVGVAAFVGKGGDNPGASPSATASASAQTKAAPTIAVGAASERPTDADAGPSPSEASRPMTTLPLSFAINSAEFQIGNPQELDAIIAELKRSLGAGVIEIGGHTSTEGPDDFNRDLSLRRAASVKKLLVSRGIPENRMVVQAYQMTAAPSAAPPEANRRVTIRILR